MPRRWPWALLRLRAAWESRCERRAASRCSAYSIRSQLSQVLALQTVVFLSVVAALSYAVTSMLMGAKHDEALQTQVTVVQEIARKALAKGGEPALVDLLAEYAPRRPGTHVAVRRDDGEEIYRDAVPAFDIAAATSQHLDFEVRDATGAPAGLQGRLWMDHSADARTLHQLLTWLLVTVATGGALAWGATTWRVRHALAPLREVADQTRSIDAVHLGRRVQLRRPVVELQPGVDQFNHLLDRLERAYRQLDGFNADVAHELRTPLATLIGQAELALVRDRSAEELRDTLVSGLEELQRLSAMVNDMLFLASADRGAAARRGAPVRLSSLVHQVADFHEAALEDAAVAFEVQGDATACVDEPLVKRALSNLIGNATRFAGPGSTVVVRCEQPDALTLRIGVENEGSGIAPEDLPRLFDRFFRVDAARTCCDPADLHHGLGLSIVAAIARMHGGGPWAESADGRTRVGFTLRLDDAAG